MICMIDTAPEQQQVSEPGPGRMVAYLFYEGISRGEF